MKIIGEIKIKSFWKYLSSFSMITVFFLMSGCGSSGDTSVNFLGSDDISLSNVVDGGAVTGPIANAKISIYAFDSGNANFRSTQPIVVTYTKPTSGFSDLKVETEIPPPYIMEMTSVEGTINLNTNLPPVLSKMKTVITQEMIDNKDKIFATPLTSVALELAIANVFSNIPPYTGEDFSSTKKTVDRFLAALPLAEQQVKGTLGFGIINEVNIFNTPPQIDTDTKTIEEMTDSIKYRVAITALTSLLEKIIENSQNINSDAALAAITLDLSDGKINGMYHSQQVPEVSARIIKLFSQDPESFGVPNTNINVSEIEEIVKKEIQNTGELLNTGLIIKNIVALPPSLNPDLDNDGIMNANDRFPTDSSADVDTDLDGLPDVSYLLDTNGKRTKKIDLIKSDPDDDNDGVIDSKDAFPLNVTEWVDTDGDGIGDNADLDDDGDGVADVDDPQPLDRNVTVFEDLDKDGWPKGQDPDQYDPNNPIIDFVDTDRDGLANEGGLNPDPDDDNDGVFDLSDVFPLNGSEQLDFDGDGTGDNADEDIDNDGVLNSEDAFPRNALEYIDTDGDGIGNNSDPDDDNDMLSDTIELTLGTDPLMKDTDSDGVFDNADDFPLDATEQIDTDNDGLGDVADKDDDNDGVLDVDDAFPIDPSETADFDKDGIGDNKDEDDDGDKVKDLDDIFPNNAAEWLDSDLDGTGNNADIDDDNDGVNDEFDAFPLNAKESLDTDADGKGNNSDRDDDGDRVPDRYDMFPLDATEWVDLDGDGIGNNADADDGAGEKNSENDDKEDKDDSTKDTGPLSVEDYLNRILD